MTEKLTIRETPHRPIGLALIACGLLAAAALIPVGAAAAELRHASRSDGLASTLTERAAPRAEAALPQAHRAGPRPIGRFQPLLPSRDPADALVDPASLGKKSD